MPLYILNRCECFDEKTTFKFFLKMNHIVFIFLFVLIPLVAIALLFIKMKWNEAKLEEEDLVKLRQGNSVEFEQKEFHRVRDELIKGRSESKSGAEIQLQETRKSDLNTKLTE